MEVGGDCSPIQTRPRFKCPMHCEDPQTTDDETIDIAAATDPVSDAEEVYLGDGKDISVRKVDRTVEGGHDDPGEGLSEETETIDEESVNPDKGDPIDYETVDETPYEHKFEPGDHIIRWDMLPILWPIQIHGIVLEVSDDKSEVTICDFGVTSVKDDADDKKVRPSEQSEKVVEEENAKFNEAIMDKCLNEKNDEKHHSTAESPADLKDAPPKKEDPKPKKRQRLNVIKLTKWSDLRTWRKVDYERGLLNVPKGGVGKGLKKLGKQTEKLWSSVTKSFVKDDACQKDNDKKAWRSVRYDFDDEGYCVHHPEIQLQRPKDNGNWAVVRKKCPECIKIDCPAMMGEEIIKSRRCTPEAAPVHSNIDGERSTSGSKTATSEEEPPGEESCSNKPPRESIHSNEADSNDEPAQQSTSDSWDNHIMKSEPKEIEGEQKSLAQMISEANEIEKRSRKVIVKTSPSSSEIKSINRKQQSWRGSFMKSIKSLSGMFPSANADGISGETRIESMPADVEERATDTETQSNGLRELPRSDPPVLVLARTRFILGHGENILPPYHIINSNSECIAVWCKTGRWSTLQAAVFLHSTAIGHAKSATALTLGVAATQPWLIPAFATVGLAAVGTPWLFLKVANDKWNEATNNLTEKFWMQAEPEVFIECIERWGNIT